MTKAPAKRPRVIPPEAESFDVPSLFVNHTHVMAGPGFIRIGFAEQSKNRTHYVTAVAMSATTARRLAKELHQIADQVFRQNVDLIQATLEEEDDTDVVEP